VKTDSLPLALSVAVYALAFVGACVVAIHIAVLVVSILTGRDLTLKFWLIDRKWRD
jgi:hypothetical protein